MALIRALSGGGSGGGDLKLYAGTVSGTSVSFTWDYDADDYVVFWVLGGTYQQIAIGEIGSDSIKFGNPNAGDFFISSSLTTWTSASFTRSNETSRSITLTHSSLNYTSGTVYILPLKSKVTT